MKTGELFLNIKREDVKSIFAALNGKDYNKLSPFSEVLESDFPALDNKSYIDSILKNNDVVYLLKALANPSSILQIRIIQNEGNYKKLSVICTAEKSFILVIYDGEKFGVQYFADIKSVSDILNDVCVNNDAEEGEMFPGSISVESLIMYLNLIDSYKYAKYRDALRHHYSSLLKITSEEFYNLLQDSMKKFDSRWMLSNFIFLLPSVTKSELSAKPEIYEELFKTGFLISVSDKNTNEESLLLDVKTCDAGAEFFELWAKSTGIQYSFIKEGKIETTPLAFIASTQISNHCFLMSEGSNIINYQNYLPIINPDIFYGFLTGLITTKTQAMYSEPLTKFCGKCGNKLSAGAKFCGACGNIITN